MRKPLAGTRVTNFLSSLKVTATNHPRQKYGRRRSYVIIFCKYVRHPEQQVKERCRIVRHNLGRYCNGEGGGDGDGEYSRRMVSVSRRGGEERDREADITAECLTRCRATNLSSLIADSLVSLR